MADRIATCLGCGISWKHLADRAKVPEWCGDCHRRRAADRVRAKYEKRPCRVAKCVDCGRFIAIVNRPGKLPRRCGECRLVAERARQQARRHRDPDSYRAASARWRMANLDLARQRARKVSHHRRAVETRKVTTAEVERMLAKPCAYCGAPSEHIDHIIPLSRGGRHSIGNLTGACAKCNKSKSNKLLVEWRLQRKENNHAVSSHDARIAVRRSTRP